MVRIKDSIGKSNKGKTYEERYGEKANRIRKKISDSCKKVMVVQALHGNLILHENR